jgi:hypothetical protein
VRRDGLLVLAARGLGSAFGAWKALLLALALNALLAAALVRPVGAALHDAADQGPVAGRLLSEEKATFWDHFTRAHRDVFGDLSTLDDLATGEEVKRSLLSLGGAAGALVWLSLVSALLAALLSGGFAGRFGADRDRASLAAFGADCGRFAFSSLLLGLLSLTGIVLSYRFLFSWPGRLYEASELRYEWEAVALLFARLLAFLLAAAFVRLVVLYARAEIGLTRNGNPFLALATAAGFVAGRPGRTLSLELLFGAVGLAPLLAWALWAPVWSGSDALALVLLVAAQELVVFWRIAARAAHLGAASAFLRRSRDVVERPVPARVEVPAPAAAP